MAGVVPSSKNVSIAPPPVETKPNLLFKFRDSIAATVSPPPTILKAPEPAICLAKIYVPPIAPFS